MKFGFYLDLDNRGRIETDDLNDFITFVWCNPSERFKLLNEKIICSSLTKVNYLQVCLK